MQLLVLDVCFIRANLLMLSVPVMELGIFNNICKNQKVKQGCNATKK